MGEIGFIETILVSVTVTLIASFFTYLWIKGEKYSYMIAGLSHRNHPFKDTYLFGFAFLDLIQYRYTNVYDRKMERTFRVLYGQQYFEYYRRVHMAQKISVSIPVFVIFCVLAIAVNDWLLLLLAVGGTAGVLYYFEAVVFETMAKRKAAISKDFPEVLSKITLLVNAGMMLRDAWSKAAFSGSGILYVEMQKTSEQSDNGVSEYDAYSDFVIRCCEPTVDKTISALVQNLSKGNRELVEFLKRTSQESWNVRKQSVRRKGEEASTKMLIPIGLMFLGILLMVMLPIIGSMAY